MKKILLLILVILTITTITQKAQCKTNLAERHDIFTPAFQLLWNDFSNLIIKDKIKFQGMQPKVLKKLNANKFTQDEISQDFYYKILALKTPELRLKIQDDLMKKFNEKSDLLDSIDWQPTNAEEYILYAMLKKDINFQKEFEILESKKFNNSKEKVKYFGVKNENNELKYQVKPLFWLTAQDFAVALDTNEGDKIILHRTNAKNDIYERYDYIIKHQKTGLSFGESDKLIVPFVNIDEKIQYDALENRKIIGSELYISKAIEIIKFKLDNKGASIKNEALLDIMTCSLPIPGRERMYKFDKPFNIYLIEKDAKLPYFAVRIKDTEYLEKE